MTTLQHSQRASLVARAAALVAVHYANGRNKIKISNRKGIPHRTQVRRSVEDIHQCLAMATFVVHIKWHMNLSASSTISSRGAFVQPLHNQSPAKKVAEREEDTNSPLLLMDQ